LSQDCQDFSHISCAKQHIAKKFERGCGGSTGLPPVPFTVSKSLKKLRDKDAPRISGLVFLELPQGRHIVHSFFTSGASFYVAASGEVDESVSSET
jgi:hypothetical protein